MADYRSEPRSGAWASCGEPSGKMGVWFHRSFMAVLKRAMDPAKAEDIDDVWIRDHIAAKYLQASAEDRHRLTCKKYQRAARNLQQDSSTELSEWQ